MSNQTVFSELSSHVSDHIENQEVINWVQTHPELLSIPVTHNENGDPDNFFIKVIPMPEEIGTLPCSLYGPAAGDAPVSEDDVHYETRGNRRGPSRMVMLPTREATNVAVIGIRGGVCFTMYGSRASEASPKEPWDAANPEELLRCVTFWDDHALAGGSGFNAARVYRTSIHFGGEDAGA